MAKSNGVCVDEIFGSEFKSLMQKLKSQFGLLIVHAFSIRFELKFALVCEAKTKKKMEKIEMFLIKYIFCLVFFFLVVEVILKDYI